MARQFSIPDWYRSPIVSKIKKERAIADPRKKDLSPSVVELPGVTFKIARHFGFCYGVEHAIETAFKALEENPGKRIFLLSEMIHNPAVNRDLETRGVKFLMRTDGTFLIPLETITPDDVVIVPAFGTTVQMIQKLEAQGITPSRYDATCPFVEKVWTRSKQLGAQGYTIVIHGKHYHEETRATFSRAALAGPSIVIRDMNEAEKLAKFIRRAGTPEAFYEEFAGKYSEDFDPTKHLSQIGVVNQTTMLAHETIEIADFLRDVVMSQKNSGNSEFHFAETRDTLCYATEENQSAIVRAVEDGGDVAIVVGGYNSSNTTHLAKICSSKLPTFHIQDEQEIISASTIRHFSYSENKVAKTDNWLPSSPHLTILLSAGASSPDSLVDAVIQRIVTVLEANKTKATVNSHSAQ